MRTHPPEALQAAKLPDQVQFNVHDMDLPSFPRPAARHLALPSSRYLEIHPACCKVAHTSGAAEYLDRVMRDAEQIGVLAEDGGSADVLSYAMSRLVAPG